MDAAVFIASIETALRPFVEGKGGRLSVAADPDHVFEILANSPQGWRLILSYAGDDSIDPDTAPGMLDIQINATVQVSNDFSVHHGSNAHLPAPGGRESLITLATLVSQWMRGLTGEHPDIQDKGIRQLSGQWLAIEGLPTRQINRTFAIRLATDKPISVPVVFPEN